MTRLSKINELLKAQSIAGMDEPLRRTASNVLSIFGRHFAANSDPDVAIGFVPGRLEIAGKHTDYGGGHTLVCAIERGFLFAASASTNGTMDIIEDSEEFAPLEFPFVDSIEPPSGRWANYPMTMAQRVASNFGKETALTGVNIAFASTMPVGSGMSGSSALMMMCFCAIAMVNRLHQFAAFRSNIRDGIDLAMYLACAENGQSFRGLTGGKGVGTFGGSEDHMAILNCKEGAASLYQYAPTVFKAEAAWPPEWALVVGFSGVRAEKTKEAMERYNLASRRAVLAVRAYNRIYGKKLRSLSEIEAETRGIAASVWLKKLDGSGVENEALDLQGRTRQFLLEERETTPQALKALLWRDIESFGASINASHRASRRLLGNIVPEIDFLQRSAVKLGAAGATGFGAGFGGSIFAVVHAEKAAEFAAAWSKEYAKRYPQRASDSAFFVTRPSSGIRIWDERGSSRFVDTIFSA
jgi:galactokinase